LIGVTTTAALLLLAGLLYCARATGSKAKRARIKTILKSRVAKDFWTRIDGGRWNRVVKYES
jgi:hypothetical protein